MAKTKNAKIKNAKIRRKFPDLYTVINLLIIIITGEMVTAWLKQEDNVLEESGKPSWSSLLRSLKEHGHNGIVAEIEEHLHQSSS